LLDGEVPGTGAPRVERARERFGVVVGRVNRHLEVHPEVGVGQERVQGPLVLLVAARGAQGEVRLAVAPDYRRRKRCPGPFSGLQRIGHAVLEPEHLASGTKAEAEFGHDGRTM
jgi:hypothetical protein